MIGVFYIYEMKWLRVIALLNFVLFCSGVFAQSERTLADYQPTEDFENIHVRKINEDSLQSTFIIWVKKEVAPHFHEFHTENIVVLEGRATMQINDSVFTIRKGDYLNIPKGIVHAVLSVESRKSLKVLSIQSPIFDGSDRILIKEKRNE